MVDRELLYQKLESMLTEVDNICRENGIRYYLIEEALALSIRLGEFPKSRKEFSVAIPVEDVDKFISVVDGIQGRAVESLCNNDRFPGFYFKYVDLNTTLYNVSSKRVQYKYNAIGINVCVILNNVKSKNALERLKLSIIKKWARIVKRNNRKIKAALFMAFSRIIDMTKVWRSFLENDEPCKKKRLFLSNGTCIELSEIFFGKGKDVAVDGHSYKVPDNDIEVALKSNHDSLMLTSSKNVVKRADIVSFSFPGTEFMNAMESKGNGAKWYSRKYNKFKSWERSKFKPVWQKRKSFYRYYFLTRDRFYFHEQYCGDNKEKIAALFNQKRYDELYELLKEYLDKLMSYGNKDMGLYFDREIYEISIKTLLKNIADTEKNAQIADERMNEVLKNTDMIFWQHLQPVDMFLMGKMAVKEDMELIRADIKREIHDFANCLCK